VVWPESVAIMPTDDEIIARARASTERRKKIAAGEPDEDGKPAEAAHPGKGLGALAVQKLGIAWDGVGGMPYCYADEYKAALEKLTEEERTAHWEARHNDPDDVYYRQPKGDPGVLIFLGEDGKPLEPQPTPEERAEERRKILEERERMEQAAREAHAKYMAEVKAAAEKEKAEAAAAKAVEDAGDSATGVDA
jgi:hypothetical protein